MTGFEPAASTSRTYGHTDSSDGLSVVASITDPQRTNERTNSPEKEHTEASSGSFSAALAMIASLPLSDAEKANAVRRLMAEQAIAQPPKLRADALSASDERDRSQTGGRA